MPAFGVLRTRLHNVNAILYGVELVLYFLTMQKLYQNRKRGGASNKFFIFFSSALLVLITIYMSAEAVFGEETWIVNAGFPGGDAAYMEMYASVWYQTMGTGASVVLNLLCDGLMIYRCFLVWNSRYVVILPCFLWVSSLGLGAAELYASGSSVGDMILIYALEVHFSADVGRARRRRPSLDEGKYLRMHHCHRVPHPRNLWCLRGHSLWLRAI